MSAGQHQTAGILDRTLRHTGEPLVLLGLCGLAGSGKSTAADYLVRRLGFTELAFADGLKQDVCEPLMENLGVDYAYLYEPHLKNAPLPGAPHLTARMLMQEFGDAGRRCSPRFWIDQLAGAAGLRLEQWAPVSDRIVVSDVLLGLGGTLLRLHRTTAEPVRAHSSEAYALHLPASVDLHNEGPTLEGLHSLLRAQLAVMGVHGE
jgi:hypothetical protein